MYNKESVFSSSFMLSFILQNIYRSMRISTIDVRDSSLGLMDNGYQEK